MCRAVISCIALQPSLYLAPNPPFFQYSLSPQRNDGPYYRPVQQPAQSQYRPQIAAPGLPGSGGINSGSPADEGILSTLSNGFNSLVNNIFG